MVKKRFFSLKKIVVIALIAVGGFTLIDFYSCTLKQGVPMDTTNVNDFLYGELTPLFCTIIDLNDSEGLGVLVDEYIFGGTEPVEGADLFTIPFDDPIQELVIEDPNGEIGLGDPDDILIDEDQFMELEMLQNQTDTTDPLIGDNVTEILPPEADPLPEELTPMLVDMAIITEVTKIFTDLTEETVTSEFQLLPLALFVEDTSNKDISEGRFVTVLKIKTDPNIFVEGDGLYDVFLDNQTLNQSPISLSFSGTTDQNGELIINFVSPTGATSQDFLLNVPPLTPMIQTTGITPLEFRILELNAKAFEVDYSAQGLPVFTFDFFRDQNQILIVNQEGLPVRVFPTDDQLNIGAQSGSVRVSSCYKHMRYACWMTRISYRSLGAPTIASLEVRNSNGDLVLQNIAPFTNFIVKDLITRNDTYTVNYGKVTSTAGSLPAGSFTFTAPEEQKNFSFRCTIAQASASVGSGFCSKCLTPSGNPYLTCNFPK